MTEHFVPDYDPYYDPADDRFFDRDELERQDPDFDYWSECGWVDETQDLPFRIRTLEEAFLDYEAGLVNPEVLDEIRPATGLAGAVRVG